MKIKSYNRGDTIVEVLIAITVFSMVVVSSLAIMSSGLSSTQRALESTKVRQEIDSQAAALRFLQGSFISSYVPGTQPLENTPQEQWYQMIEYIKQANLSSASQFGGLATTTCPAAPAGSFILNTRKAKFVSEPSLLKTAPIYAQVNYDTSDNLVSAEGVWIEGIRSINSTDPGLVNVGYIDFHIRACWSSVGQSAPLTLGTIVRLYDPR